MRSLVISIFLHACQSWILTAELQRRIQAVEMRCYRKILRISYKDHVTNEKVRAKVQQATNNNEHVAPYWKTRCENLSGKTAAVLCVLLIFVVL